MSYIIGAFFKYIHTLQAAFPVVLHNTFTEVVYDP